MTLADLLANFDADAFFEPEDCAAEVVALRHELEARQHHEEAQQ